MVLPVMQAEPSSKRWIQASQRLDELPPYLFVEIDRAKKAARQRGVDIVDFGVGDPDRPTPLFVIRAFNKALKDPRTHRYPLDLGSPTLRIAIAKWYKTRFGVKLDPDGEVLPLIGSKEGLVHLPLAYINPGDRVLVPDPAYPAYRGAVLFAGGIPVTLPLLEQNGFLPNWPEIEKKELTGVRLAYLNYPNNPTGATAGTDFFQRTVEFAQKHKILICHDNAYSEIHDAKTKPASFLGAKGAKNVGVEFHSLSKTFNMTGWRIGFACGNAQVIAALAKLKSNIDSGVFSAIQLAGASALRYASSFTRTMNAVYNSRRTMLAEGLREMGLRPFVSGATFYLWARIPERFESSMEYAKHLLEKAGVVVTPGNGFGSYGEGYVRFTLTLSNHMIRKALKKMRESNR